MIFPNIPNQKYSKLELMSEHWNDWNDWNDWNEKIKHTKGGILNNKNEML